MNTQTILIGAREAGQLLHMLPARVKRLAKRGEIPCVILPDGEIRFCADHLREWVEECRQPPVSSTEAANA